MCARFWGTRPLLQSPNDNNFPILCIWVVVICYLTPLKTVSIHLSVLNAIVPKFELIPNPTPRHPKNVHSYATFVTITKERVLFTVFALVVIHFALKFRQNLQRPNFGPSSSAMEAGCLQKGNLLARTEGTNEVFHDIFMSFLSTEVSESGNSNPSWKPGISVDAIVPSDQGASFVDFVGSIDEDGCVDEDGRRRFRCHLDQSQFSKVSPTLQIWTVEDNTKEVSYPKTFSLGFKSVDMSNAFGKAMEDLKSSGTTTDEVMGNGTLVKEPNKFDKKIESASAKMYFHYYGQLLHQQNMLQDYVRTGTYYAAIMENSADFQGRVVVDVGAGSGILSLFAAQAGAKHVYAVEASSMADYARRLISGNPALAKKITVIHGKVEDIELPERADILISEPMGTLLVNERMLESYIIARDRLLSPVGRMFPSIGRIHMAPFTDEYLFVEIANKALFWQQQNYYGVDLTPLHGDAFQGYFAQPVVDAFDPRLLVSTPVVHTIDFQLAKEEELYEIDIPMSFTASVSARVHGLACWFDVLFDGSNIQRWLTTAPGAPTTHWYQLRCVLSQPIYVMAGQLMTANLRLVAHSAQSYTIHLTMSAASWGAGSAHGGILQTASGKLDLKEPYYRMSQPQAYSWNQEQQQQPVCEAQMQTQVDGAPVVQSGVLLQNQQAFSQPLQQANVLLQAQQPHLAASFGAQQQQQYYNSNYWGS